MSQSFGIYELGTGRFAYVLTTPRPEGPSAFELADVYGAVVVPDDFVPDLHYYDSELRIRQALDLSVSKAQIIADGEDEVVVSGVPANITVTWPDGQTDTVTDGEVRLSVDLPGTYTLRFTAVPYLDQEVIIEAVAAA